MRIQVSTVVNSSANTVFAYLTEPEKLTRWQTFLAEAEQLSEGAVVVGSKFRNVLRHPGFDDFGVLTLEIAGEVVIYEPAKRLQVKGHSKVINLITDYQLHGLDNQTTVEQTAEFELRGLLLRPIANMMEGFLSEQFQADLQNLKLLVESEQGQN